MYSNERYSVSSKLLLIVHSKMLIGVEGEGCHEISCDTKSYSTI